MCKLQNPEKVQESQNMLLSCLLYLMKKNNPEQPLRFAQVCSCLLNLRTVKELHVKEEEGFLMEWSSRVELPRLMYEIWSTWGSAEVVFDSSLVLSSLPLILEDLCSFVFWTCLDGAGDLWRRAQNIRRQGSKRTMFFELLLQLLATARLLSKMNFEFSLSMNSWKEFVLKNVSLWYFEHCLHIVASCMDQWRSSAYCFSVVVVTFYHCWCCWYRWCCLSITSLILPSFIVMTDLIDYQDCQAHN